jgi:hypothetical protein
MQGSFLVTQFVESRQGSPLESAYPGAARVPPGCCQGGEGRERPVSLRPLLPTVGV